MRHWKWRPHLCPVHFVLMSLYTPSTVNIHAKTENNFKCPNGAPNEYAIQGVSHNLCHQIFVDDFSDSVMIIIADYDVRGADRLLIGIAHRGAKPGRFQHRDIVEGVANANGLFNRNAQDIAQIREPGPFGDALRCSLQRRRLRKSEIKRES